MKAIEVSISRSMESQNVVYSGILVSLKKEDTLVYCDMVEP